MVQEKQNQGMPSQKPSTEKRTEKPQNEQNRTAPGRDSEQRDSRK